MSSQYGKGDADLQQKGDKSHYFVILHAGSHIPIAHCPACKPTSHWDTAESNSSSDQPVLEGGTSTPLPESIMMLFLGLGEDGDCLKSQLSLLSSEILRRYFSPM